MTPRTTGSRAYHLGLFAAISVLCGLLVAGLAIPLAALGGSALKAGASSLESLPAELEIGPQSERSRVLMANGEPLAEFYSENRVYVPLKSIAPIMRVAQVAIEDSRFYEHGAIDFRGTARAALRSASGSTQGGSTLTQQYVKQVQIEAAATANDPQGVEKAREQTLARKIRELRYAVAVEKKLSKDQILERYLNIAYYGDGAYGVEAAAHHYFNSTASKLTLGQSAMLAGLVQNPVATDPVNHPSAAIQRRNVVLNRMLELKLVTAKQVAAAKKETFNRALVQAPRNGCTVSRYPTLCLYVYNVLTSDRFAVLGKTREDRVNTLNRGGLTIQTLINPTAQDAAQDAVGRRIAPTDPFISTAVLIQPKTGLIVSMAQNRPKLGDGAGQTWFNYAVDAKNGGAEGYQAGSTFKTFTMAAALANGITPSKSFDSPSGLEFKGKTFTSCSGPFPSPEYHPKNSTRSGRFTMVEAAKWSVNTYFVQLERAAGLCNVVKTAQAAGVKLANGQDMVTEAHMDSFVAFTLGIAEVTPLSMAEAYATFANRGVHCDPIIIESITTKAGKPVNVPSANCQKVMEPAVADAVSMILKQVITSGTAAPAHLADNRDQAAKTGTIDGAEAVWLAGYTPDMAGIAMIAADKQAPVYKGKTRRSLTGKVSHGTDCGSYGCYLDGSGGRDAGKIWRAAMNAALADVPPTRFTAPTGEVTQGRSVEIPPIAGMGLRDAMAQVEAAGFDTAIVNQPSDQPKGTFLYAYPSRGTYPVSRTIQFFVSSGPAPSASPTPGAKPTPSATPSASTRPSASTKPTPSAKASR